MRVIPLKTFAPPVGGAEGSAAILALVVNTPLVVARGFDPQDMKLTLQVLDKLDAATDELVLEDEEWRSLNQKLQQYPFGIAHKELLLLTDAVKNAQAGG